MNTSVLSASMIKTLTWGVVLGGYEDDSNVIENGDSSSPSNSICDTISESIPESINKSIVNDIGDSLEPLPVFDVKTSRPILR